MLSIKWWVILLAVILGVLAYFMVWQPWETEAIENHQQVCFCHNVNRNPHTICTANQGYINGHLRHVRNGQDTFGECTQPSPTPEPSESPSPSPTNTPIPCGLDEEGSEPCPISSPTPQPSREPESTPQPQSLTQAGGGGEAPVCPDVSPTVTPPNFHILRTGQLVEAKWLPEEPRQGNEVSLYWGLNGEGMQHSLLTANEGYERINLY